jgi:signal transduction histidine kinase
MTEGALLVAAGTLAAGVTAALLLRLLGTVRLQLAGLALLAVALPLGGVLASGWVMFHMHDDAKILAASSAAALSAVVGALILARWILKPLDELRDASRRLAAGDLTARAPEAGPREFAQMGETFNAMAASIERLFEARRELVAWASHDLRTPIASLRAMIEALEDGLAEPHEYLPLMHDRVRTLSTLVEGLTELTRIDAGVLADQAQVAEIRAVVDSCIQGFAAEARARQISIESRVHDELPPAACAPQHLERVLGNLITNALRHTPEHGTIAVDVQSNGGSVTIAVEDSGAGVSQETRERMFDRFWRGENARSGTGSGLGLAIARGLVESHGGKIWAEAATRGGARVAFTLPLAS